MSLETVLWMAICSCGLPACCCQPAVARCVIYADLRSELNTHLALQASQGSPVCKPQLQAFPFPSTLGEVTLHLLPLACMFIYSSHGKWVLPHLLWSFPPTATFTSLPTPDCWAVLLLLPDTAFVYSSCGRWVLELSSLILRYLFFSLNITIERVLLNLIEA
jgi:hypothetical protein